jgi:hypothetical protein
MARIHQPDVIIMDGRYAGENRRFEATASLKAFRIHGSARSS